jgi:DNA-binding NarL/FixJ family response regulator
VSAPISILIYEDNDLLRESIGRTLLLNEGYIIIGSFGDVLTVEEQVKMKPDLILMDIDLPGMTGIEAVKKIRAAGLDVPILMLTVFDDNQHVFDALCEGASGYLLKKHIFARLPDAIGEVLTGGAPMSPSVARMVIQSMQLKLAPPDLYRLTAREKEVLQLLSKGNSYKLIAADCEITIDTVRAHIKKIYEKLHVHSQTEAVSKAINEGLVKK